MDLCSPSEEKLFDPIRQLWVAATGEEKVRQWLIHKMTEELGYPRELLTVERQIRDFPSPLCSGAPKRRVDLACFMKEQDQILPLIVFECKDCLSLDAALAQVIGYNYFIQAPFVGVVGGEGNKRVSLFGVFDTELKQYVFNPGIPSYAELCKVR